MLIALIMAGGSGSRFWPMSTEEKPKQFLSLVNDKTMIQDTVDRLKSLIDIEHIFVCTCNKYENLVREQLPDLPKRNIVIEPFARNTAPCILLSTLYIKQIYGDANVIVLPSDHKINVETEFLNILSDANTYLENNCEAIITIGIKPDRPETGYGYIKYGKVLNKVKTHEFKKVIKFVEKPNQEKANQYLTDDHYLWNAGMFIFNVNFMINEFNRNSKKCYELLTSLPKIDDSKYTIVLEEQYKKCDSVSIDYAIMEKSNNICVVPADFEWDDIGSWKSLERYIVKDENNNIIKGNTKIINSKYNIIYGNNKRIILLDVDNIFCIDVNDTLIIGKRDSISEVYKLRSKYEL